MNLLALVGIGTCTAAVIGQVAMRHLRFARLVVAGLLVAAIAFSSFGFLASFEPPGSPGARAIYAGIGIVVLAGAVWLVAAGRSSVQSSHQ